MSDIMGKIMRAFLFPCKLFLPSRKNDDGRKGGAAVAPYILKGTQFFVTGELSMNTYTDSSGVEKQNLELNVNSIDLIGNRNDAQPSPQSAPQQQAPEGQPFDDELPF